MKKESILLKILKSLISLLNIIVMALFCLLLLKDNNVSLTNVNELLEVFGFGDKEVVSNEFVSEVIRTPKTEVIDENNIVVNVDLSSSSLNLSSDEQEDEREDEGEEDSGNPSNGFFMLYDQIDDYSQYIYEEIDDNFYEMLNGNCEIELGTCLTPLIDGKTNEKLQQAFQSAVTAYIYDNPLAFVFDFTKMSLYIDTISTPTSTKLNFYIKPTDGTSYFSDQFQNATSAKQAISRVENVKNSVVRLKTGNIYDDCKIVHDYLVDTIDYDKNLANPNSFDVYGALVDNTCVCDGYAKSFSYLMQEMGYDIIRVVGTGTNTSGVENHAWNIVEIDGTYYGIDCTWDDPIVYGGGSLTSSEKYRFFMKNDADFRNSHIPNGQFTDNGQRFVFPTL